jgi:hypothetical protein
MKYVQDDRLQELIDWDNIMPMARNAGGHDDQMCGLFKDATVLGHWNEGDWQGTVATCVKLDDGRVVIYNDYYGSCSGCDAWENASDEDAYVLCRNLANSAYVFENKKDVLDWLDAVLQGNLHSNSYSWDMKTVSGLSESIYENLK